MGILSLDWKMWANREKIVNCNCPATASASFRTLEKRSGGEMANGIEPLQFDILRRLDSLIIKMIWLMRKGL